MIVEIFIFFITSIVAFFLYTHYNLKRNFEKGGVKFLPGVPVFGNALKSTLQRSHMIDDLDNVYKAFPGERYVGYIEATMPVILIRDPELIKQITVKDFDYFVDHRQFFPEEVEPLFGGSVFLMKGERWRDMRTTLSPAFTGSKMRQMMPFMTDISDNIIKYLRNNFDKDEELDVGDLVRRYTNDVIASAGFGLKVDSLKDRDNEFYKFGQKMFKFGFWQRIVFFFVGIFPNLAVKLGLKVFPQKNVDFFQNIVKTTIDFREKNNVERPDMIQLLMEASKGKLQHGTNEEKDSVGYATVDEALKPRENVRNWTLTELSGQVFIFFAAGFESSATAIVMCIHELTVNPDIQEKLYQEVKAFKDTHGKLTFDNVNDLKYLDCVLNETMRKWAAALIMDRVCTKPYQLPPPHEGGKPYQLQPGDVVYNVVNPIHMDAQYFPNPEKFDPDRFSDENKHDIRPFTYMPFGMGPRNCIGSRFALLELKVLLYDLILNFKFVKGKKTTDPIVLEPADFNIRALGGTFAKLEVRN